MRWGHVRGRHVVAALGLVGLAMAGCADELKRAAEDVVQAEVVDYAEGDWQCELALLAEAIPATLDGSGTLGIDATVRSTGDAQGDVVFAIDGPFGAEREFLGAWELDGTDLQVDVPAFTETSYAMAEVDIATDHIEIQEDQAGAELVPVNVEREGDTVLFGWDDPWSGDPTEMACTKA
jgi:hypothetical protein